ncbi:P-loop containing nucleoside triphosphate hydrolase [Pseudocohnilembus persalinus]|uniref:Kinesin-like protein n=1 Tax=Pseudocohnilembus persalinus TaxID=266149 RepID=A0A0V0QWV5_PSEPJ|nr:P-loop containing nucleoside triphosphate hydrolase [Pseudocohnilembus persalinus]|eukprot:KRX06694.1 P-loop containing nucleoside triphosphate hydrolase [Pseudocohnilembus persalinus]
MTPNKEIKNQTEKSNQQSKTRFNGKFTYLINKNTTYKKILLTKEEQEKYFVFDHIFEPATTQDQLYKLSGQHILDSVFQGINGTIMAYGQTGSGKTYTIFGTKQSIDQIIFQENLNQQQYQQYIPKNIGFAFRVIDDIFTRIQTNSEMKQYKIKISLMEIYMENIIDLLSFTKNNQQSQNNLLQQKKEYLQIREDKEQGVFVEGLIKFPVKSLKDANQLIAQAIKQRINQQTSMNRYSSRSHALIQITLIQRWVEDEYNQGYTKHHTSKSMLTIVDLAGNERLGKTSSQGLRLEETKNINKSISALGNCIAALAQESKSNNLGKKNSLLPNQHIPFRDSKLTRILSENLCGNSSTSIIACVSPTSTNYEETYNSLLFASRAMLIKVQANKKSNYKIKQLQEQLTSKNQEQDLI